MSKIQTVSNYIRKFAAKPDFNDMRYGYSMHMFGVAQFAAMIALKRGLNSELAAISGLLHDIHSLTTLDPTDHAKKGAVLAKEILNELNILTDKETDIVCTAISHHSDKKNIHSPYDEILKDADVMNHCMYDITTPPSKKDMQRFNKLVKEFELNYQIRNN